jgi:hypothetical protein
MPTSYGSTASAKALVPAHANFSESSTPTQPQVEAWLSEGYSIINRHLAAAGYSIPVASSAAVYGELRGLNNLYAGAYVLRATGMDISSGDREERSEVWLKDFFARLKELAASDLTAVGVTQTAVTTGRRRRIRTLQLRRIDGYSGDAEGAVAEYAYPSE